MENLYDWEADRADAEAEAYYDACENINTALYVDGEWKAYKPLFNNIAEHVFDLLRDDETMQELLMALYWFTSTPGHARQEEARLSLVQFAAKVDEIVYADIRRQVDEEWSEER
jgi:hypothetical protein